MVRQQQAEELVRDFKAVEDQVDKVSSVADCVADAAGGLMCVRWWSAW